MDIVWKKSFEISAWVVSLPQVHVKKGCVLMTVDGKVCRAGVDLRLLPFTLHAVDEHVDGSVDEVRKFRRVILDFTHTMHAFFRFADVDATAAHIWPVLFPGFDGVTDGKVTSVFGSEATSFIREDAT